MPAFLDCPEIECWQALLGDRVPETERESYERHLESCPACQERLRRIEEDDNSLRRLGRRVGDPTVVPADPTLVQVLGQLHGAKTPLRIVQLEPADLYFLRPSEQPGVLGLLGDYEVREVIGQGCMGLVFKAFEPALHRLVAIKVMATALAGSATARRRFTREAQAAAAVCHDHIIAVHGVSETAGLPYLVMQYVDGESLQERLDRVGPLEVAEIVRIGLQTASGLAAAHAQGLIHRDIKPANLLLENGLARVKITDFGLARLIDDVGLTQNGVVAGTPEYMAPEQARGEAVDHRADLYSLGSVLYACCTGVPPFRGSTALAVLRRVSEKEPASIRSLNPDVPAWLEAFIARLMAKDPAERFQSAAEVAQLLESYLAHLRQPNAAPIPEFTSWSSSSREEASHLSWLRFPDRFPRRAWLSALAAVVVVGLGIFVWYRQSDQARVERLEQVRVRAAKEGSKPGKQDHLRVDLSAGIDKLPPSLSLFPPNGDAVVQADSQGWRITLPAGRNNINDVNLVVSNRLSGDFTITLGYELLDVGKPWPNYGAGLGIRVSFDAPNELSAILMRSNKPDGQWLKCHKTIRGSDGKKQFFDNSDARATRPRGKLRLVRRGFLLDYFAMEEGQEDFKLIQSVPFVVDDVPKIEFYCTTAYTPIALDVRWTELDIRADKIASQSEPVPGRHPDHLVVSLPKGIDKLPPSLSLFGPDAESVVKTDFQGWRFTLPAGRSDPNTVGLKVARRLSGDFTITLGYELLDVGKALPRWGAGVVMRVVFDASSSPDAVLSRSNRPDGPMFGAQKVLKESNGEEKYFDSMHRKATQSRGKLRLVRTGSQLRYLVAEEGQDFRIIHTTKIETADVQEVQFYCHTTYTPIALDVRWTEVDIRADKIVSQSEPVSGRHPDHLVVSLPKGIDKLPPSLSLFGPDAESVVKTDPQGWRITLPAGRDNADRVGLTVPYRLSGDFSITLGYDLLAIGKPLPRYGAGIAIRAWFDAPSSLSAILSRSNKPDGQWFGCHKIVKGPDNQDQYLENQHANATRSRGKLRLVRTGPQLQYLVREEGQIFRQLQSVKIGTADIRELEIYCTTMYTPIAMEVRWTELDMWADKIESPNPP